MQPIYIDGIANVTLVDGILRLDLVNLVFQEKDKSGLRQIGSLAMSLPALLRTHNVLAKAVDKMIEDGILKKTDSHEPKEFKETSAEIIN
jgi:hypothetical protein